MTHERLTPNVGIPLNRNMEGKNESPQPPRVERISYTQGGLKSAPKEIQAAARHAWYRGEDPLRWDAGRREATEVLIRAGKFPIKGGAPDDEGEEVEEHEAHQRGRSSRSPEDNIRAWMAQGMNEEEATEYTRQGIAAPERYYRQVGQRDKSVAEIIKEMGDESIPKTPAQVLEATISKTYDSQTISQFRVNLNNTVRGHVVNFANEKISGSEKTYLQKYEEILRLEDLDQAKSELRNMVFTLQDRYATVTEAEREEIPQSFDEFIDLIMNKEVDDYKPGGIFELRSKDGEIRYENFSAWAWSKALWWDGFSPDDTKLSFFSSASINLNYRTISLQDFITDKRYNRRSEEKIKLGIDGEPEKDRFTGEIKKTKTYHDDKDHAKMVEKIIDEMWFFNQTRNFGVAYRLAQEQDKDLLEALGGMLSTDIFTRGNGFEVLYSLAGISGEKYLDDNNGIAGELAAIGESVYDKIFDLNKMKALLGEDSTFFRKDFLRSKDSRLVFQDDNGAISAPPRVDPLRNGMRLNGELENGTNKGRGATTVRGVTGPIKWDEKWYDENGVLKTRKDGKIGLDWVRGRFLDYVNVFNEQNKDPAIVDEVRERVRQSMVEKVLKSNPGLMREDSHLYKKFESSFRGSEKYKDATDNQVEIAVRQAIIQVIYMDATRAEAVAWSNTKWFGISAMNDTTATGFDVGTKWNQTRNYRTGQGRAATVGTDLGNPRTIGIYARVMAPFKDAIKTRGKDGENRETLQEVINQIADNAFKKTTDGKSVSREKAKDLKFRASTMRTYFGNHVARGAPVYEELATGTDFDINKIITWDWQKGFTTDIPEFTKQIRDRIKKRRYLFSGFGDTDYSKNISVYKARDLSREEKKELARELGVKEVDIPSFRVIYPHEGTLGSEMFGKQVFQRNYLKKDAKKVNWDNVDWKKVNETERNVLWREAWLLEVAAGIAAHRDRMDLSKPMSYMQLEGFYRILEKVPANIVVDEENLMNTRATGYAFDKDMIKLIRKASKTEEWRMLTMEGITEGGKGLLIGLLEVLKIFASGLK